MGRMVGALDIAICAHQTAGYQKTTVRHTPRNKIKEIDPDWWKPMTDTEIDDFLDGRY